MQYYSRLSYHPEALQKLMGISVDFIVRFFKNYIRYVQPVPPMSDEIDFRLEEYAKAFPGGLFSLEGCIRDGMIDAPCDLVTPLSRSETLEWSFRAHINFNVSSLS